MQGAERGKADASLRHLNEATYFINRHGSFMDNVQEFVVIIMTDVLNNKF
jgi:hypothetical protein